MILALLASLALAQGDYAPGRAGTDPLDAEREARVQRLGKQIRCPVCQGVSIADSPSSMARAQLDKVRELVAAGRSDEEIYQYFVARYGEWALLSPSKQGVTSVLWLAPVLLILLGTLFIWLQVRKKPAAPPAAEPAVSTAAAEEDPYLAAVRKDLQQ
ncbi:MAG: cytochrome c-type biogenesis protein CcmH [Myxococcaceae bacterium]|nr:cytochrome c-type biogenesis protein CcmH [Myxococcaceae bacterium]